MPPMPFPNFWVFAIVAGISLAIWVMLVLGLIWLIFA